MKTKYVLIAEDDPNDLEFTLRALKEVSGTNAIHIVSDGVEVMDFLNCTGKFAGREKVNPALIILDKKMPRMDGLEVLKEIKKRPDLKKIPVVMFSSSNYEKDVSQSYENGVNAYVVKPINIDDFIRTVKQIGIFWGSINELPSSDQFY